MLNISLPLSSRPFRKQRTFIASLIASACVVFQPVGAMAAEEEAKGPDWVLAYFLICLCLGLAVAVLLRPSNRSDSAFSQDELNKRQEEALKKMLKH